MSETSASYLRCRVGHQWYGIDVDHVLEVLHFVMLTELPGTSADILGMMTLRDLVMPVLDLRLHFGLTDATLKLDSPIIAVRTDHGPMGLVVDDVDDIERVAKSQIASPEDKSSPYVTGFARLSNHLMLLLDVSRFRAQMPTV